MMHAILFLFFKQEQKTKEFVSFSFENWTVSFAVCSVSKFPLICASFI